MKQRVPPPNYNEKTNSVSYLKHVNRTFAKVDSILKVIQVQVNPPEGLVQAYLIHVADKSDINFRKVLELKGIKKQDQPALVDLFRVFVRSREEAGDMCEDDTKLVDQSTVLSPLLVQVPTTAPTGSGLSSGMGSSGSLQNQISKFDARDFGSALINAARDGVDRLQTPGMMGIGGSDTGSVGSGNNGGLTGLGIGGLGDPMSGGTGDNGDGESAQSQATSSAGNKLSLSFGNSDTAANLNENLRNIGRFFRRETGSRFGSKEG